MKDIARIFNESNPPSGFVVSTHTITHDFRKVNIVLFLRRERDLDAEGDEDDASDVLNSVLNFGDSRFDQAVGKYCRKKCKPREGDDHCLQAKEKLNNFRGRRIDDLREECKEEHRGLWIEDIGEEAGFDGGPVRKWCFFRYLPHSIGRDLRLGAKREIADVD